MIQKTGFSAIGLDIAEESIKLLQLKCSKDSLSLHHAAESELHNYNDKKELRERLNELLEKTRLKGKQVIMSLPGSLITTVPIKFSLREDENIEQALLREAPNYLPFPLKDEVIDYLMLPFSDQHSQRSVLLIAARREDVLGYIELLEEMGFETSAIEPRYCSLFRTIQWVQEGTPENQFIFYLDENNTIVMVLISNKIFIIREISWGVKEIKRKMEKELGLMGNKIEKVLQEYGAQFESSDIDAQEKIGPMDAREFRQILHEVITPPLEELCQEIQKVLSYCVSMVQQRIIIDHALLLGKATGIKALDEFIQQRIGLKITTWENSTKINALLKAHSFFETALGLALRNTNA
ncbi:MAG: pilus assembly protein PilM [bacterium]